jgi:hypothetical protein
MPMRDLQCDRCGESANAIHVLQGTGAAEIEFTCAAHSRRGSFRIDQWLTPPASWQHPIWPRTVREHILATEPNGCRVVALIEQRLASCATGQLTISGVR